MIGAQLGQHILYVVAESRYFKTHRLALAQAALAKGYTVSLATASSYGGFDADRALYASLGIQVYRLPIHRTSLNPLRDLMTLCALMRIIYTCTPDIIHNVAMKPVLYGTWATKAYRFFKRKRVRIINAISGFGYVFTSTSLKARIISAVLKPLLARTLARTSVIVQNAVDAEHVRDFGCTMASVHVIKGAGVDVDRFAPAKTHLLTHPYVITCVSRMLWSKGIRELLEVARRLKQFHPHIRIQLVGEPDPQNPDHVARAVLENAHHEGVIAYLGQCDAIADVYQKSHAAILPSYREGLPKSLIEACACGLPLVTTTATGCADMVLNPKEADAQAVQRGDNGFLVPVKNTNALYHACVALVSLNEGDRDAMAKASRQYAVDVLNQQCIHAQTLTIYQDTRS